MRGREGVRDLAAEEVIVGTQRIGVQRQEAETRQRHRPRCQDSPYCVVYSPCQIIGGIIHKKVSNFETYIKPLSEVPACPNS